MGRRSQRGGPQEQVLGVDIGGVLIGGRDDSASEADRDTMFSERYLESPAVPGALESLQQLASDGMALWIVSKAGPRTRQRSLAWLEHHGAWRIPGLDRSRVHFTDTREAKTAVCRRLGITAFVDDRMDVLAPMRGVVPTRLLFNPTAGQALVLEADKPAPNVSPVRLVRTWLAVIQHLQGHG